MREMIPNYADAAQYPQYQAEVQAFIGRTDYQEISPYICFKEFKFFQLRGLDPQLLLDKRKQRCHITMRINPDGTHEIKYDLPKKVPRSAIKN